MRYIPTVAGLAIVLSLTTSAITTGIVAVTSDTVTAIYGGGICAISVVILGLVIFDQRWVLKYIAAWEAAVLVAMAILYCVTSGSTTIAHGVATHPTLTIIHGSIVVVTVLVLLEGAEARWIKSPNG